MSTRPANSYAHTTLEALLKTDEKIAHLKDGAYSKAASPERLESARAALESKGFKVTVAQNRDEAFETLKTLIPDVSFCLFLCWSLKWFVECFAFAPR
jgi:hypothetical protein